jgi:sulfur carrier protein
MKVILRNPRREVELDGVRRVADLFKRLELVSESYLAIRQGELLTTEETVADEDVIELRPVISGGGDEVPGMSGQGGHSGPPPPRQLL